MNTKEFKIVQDALSVINYNARTGSNKKRATLYKLKGKLIGKLNAIGWAKFNGYFCNIKKDGNRAYLKAWSVGDIQLMTLISPPYFEKIINLGDWRSNPDPPPAYLTLETAKNILQAFLEENK